jgi:AraC-like DNA-binding protein
MDTVTLDLNLLREVAADSPESSDVQLHFTGYRPTSLAGDRFWRTTVAQARSLTAHPDATAWPLVVGSMRRLLAASALATFPNTIVADPIRTDRNDATPTTLSRAISFIEARAGDDIGLIDIARAACVTPRAVQISFRRHLDTTPLAHLRRVRLDRAREQLRAADPGQGSTVTAVAARWGFASPSRFTVHYRARYGELPSHTLRGDS